MHFLTDMSHCHLFIKGAHILVHLNPKQSNNSSFIKPNTGINHIMLPVFLNEQASFSGCFLSLLLFTLVKSNFKVVT